MPFKITPVSGCRVREPNGGPVLSEQGITVQQLAPYWTRRQNHKEVEIVEIPASVEAPHQE